MYNYEAALIFWLVVFLVFFILVIYKVFSQPSHRKIILVAGGPIPLRIDPNEKETTSQGR
jgi:cbb3-type cytochrome oxidase subunit 3